MTWHVAIHDGLVQLAVISLLLTAMATAAVWVIREPARRIRVIELTLAGLLILPWLNLLPGVPRWFILPRLAVPNSTAPLVAERRESVPFAPAEAAQPVEHMVPPTIVPLDAAPRLAMEPSLPLVGTQPPAELPRPTETRPTTTRAVSPQAPWHAAIPRDYRFWLVAIYLSGVAIMAVWSLLGLVAVKRLLRSAQPASATCREMLRKIGGPKTDRVALLVAARASQPCAFVWRRTTIVIPQDLAEGEGNEQELRWALAHEWSHVERGDVWSWNASVIVRSVYFYQPLVWWLRRQLQLSQDFVADARAARHGAVPEDYAEFLTAISYRFSLPASSAGLGIGGRTSDLHRRVIMLVENQRPLETASPRKWNLAVLSIALLFLAAVTCLRPQPLAVADEAKPPTAPDQDQKVEAPPLDPPTTPADPATPKAAAEPKPATSTTPTRTTTPEPAKNEAARTVAPTIVKVTTGSLRRIAPGDTLTLDVMSNTDDLPGHPKLLLRPSMTVVVDQDGNLSLGSGYGRVHVGDMLLHNAEHIVADDLLGTIIEQTRRDVIENKLGDPKQITGSLIKVNVRLMFGTPLPPQAGPAGRPQTSSAAPAFPSGVPGTIFRSSDEAVGPGLTSAQSSGGIAPAQTGQLYSKAPYSPAAAEASSSPRIKAGDVLNIEVEGTSEGAPVRSLVIVEPEGTIALGARYGRVDVLNKTLQEAESAVLEKLSKVVRQPEVQITYARFGLDGNMLSRENNESAKIKALEREVESLKATIQQLTSEKKRAK